MFRLRSLNVTGYRVSICIAALSCALLFPALVACAAEPYTKIRIRIVDETNKPIRGVQIYYGSTADTAPRNVSAFTGENGMTTISGLSPSDVPYFFYAKHDDFGIERREINVENLENTAVHEIVMREGQTVRGRVVCSDGKPARGWRVGALPSPWIHQWFPPYREIAEDGTFELLHVLPGTHDVQILVPSGGSASKGLKLLSDVELLEMKGPLRLNLDYPSPDSLAYLDGEVRWIGTRPSRMVRGYASSHDRQFLTRVELWPDTTEFRIGPTPPGIYYLSLIDPNVEVMSDHEAEQQRVYVRVEVPSEDKLQLELRVGARP